MNNEGLEVPPNTSILPSDWYPEAAEPDLSSPPPPEALMNMGVAACSPPSSWTSDHNGGSLVSFAEPSQTSSSPEDATSSTATKSESIRESLRRGSIDALLRAATL